MKQGGTSTVSKKNSALSYPVFSFTAVFLSCRSDVKKQAVHSTTPKYVFKQK